MSGYRENAADRRQRHDQDKRQKRRRQQELADWQAVLRTPEGRRVILGLLEHCKVFLPIWEPSAAIHWNEGQRSVGLHILGEIKDADVGLLPAMLAEPYLRAAAEERERQQTFATTNDELEDSDDVSAQKP